MNCSSISLSRIKTETVYWSCPSFSHTKLSHIKLLNYFTLLEGVGSLLQPTEDQTGPGWKMSFAPLPKEKSGTRGVPRNFKMVSLLLKLLIILII